MKSMTSLGLRGKSMLALLLACLLALIPTALIGWQVIDGIRDNLGQAYARNTTLLNREKIFSPISRELALMNRLADSQVSKEWLLDEENPVKRALFFREAEGYRRDFHDHSYFIISNSSLGYYFNDTEKPFSTAARYSLNANKVEDSWYFSTIKNTIDYNINVDHDVVLDVTKIWLNAIVSLEGKKLGVTGTGIDLSTFLKNFIANAESGVTPLIFDAQGAIQAHPERKLIAFNTGAGNKASQGSNLDQLLGSPQDIAQIHTAMELAKKHAGSVELRSVNIEGKPQLFALSYIPELKWYVATALDMRAASLLDGHLLTPALVAFVVLLLLLLAGFAFAVEKLVLGPLGVLQTTAQSMAAGNYDVALPTTRNDEIGRLSSAFEKMAHTVRDNTNELEIRVRKRTMELEQSNSNMVIAHRKINDSIDYASLIQRAILPDRQLINALGDRHTILWQPRDVVGGDFYVYREEENGCLFGVVDCAGHGVPGALMTMLAYAAIDQAIADTSIADPAAILGRTDQIIRTMLRSEGNQQNLATNLDVGFAYVDLTKREVIFSGAKIALYYSDGETVGELHGSRRAIGDKRPGEFHNVQLPLKSNLTFYITTDGFLDQAGGELGYGFGTTRFEEMILRHARLPMSEQGAAFQATLASYQGEHEQRDDITMFCFHFE
jgi:serine phosphatase RsbU (regulator of sigma subunit)